jgi:MYXO-CTERM domain-containing protein
MKNSLLVITVTVLLAAQAKAQLLFFDFNSTPANPPVTEDRVNGTPTLSLTGSDVVPAGQGGNSYTDFSGTVHAAGTAGAFSSGVDAGNNQILLIVDTTGLFDLTISYDYRATATGPSASTFWYGLGSPGPVVFTQIGTDAYTRDSAFHRISWDLSAIGALENAGVVHFLWDGFTGGSGTGTFRIDNLEMTGVPEPHEYALLAALGLLGFAVYRRRALQRA